MKRYIIIVSIFFTIYLYGDNNKTQKTSWITISRLACTKHGGKMDRDGVCEAKWSQSIQICTALKGKLPVLIQLENLVTSCGGEVGKYANAYCLEYKKSYKGKGFSDKTYWSRTEYIKMKNFAWVLNFYNGTTAYFGKSRSYGVSCTKMKL